MKKTLNVIWTILAIALVFIAWKAYCYFKNDLADDVADSAVKEAKSFSLKDWALSFLGMSTTADGSSRTTIWDWLMSKDKFDSFRGNSGVVYKKDNETGKFVI